MRVRAAALVCLLALVGALSGCGTEAVDTAEPQKRSSLSPTPSDAPALLEDPPQAPELVVHAANAVVPTQEGSRCWHSATVGSCVDVAATDPKTLPVLTGAGPATFDFPVAGWTFMATFTDFPDVPHAKHSQGVDVEQPVPGRFVVTPLKDTGDFQVALFGTGPQGDYTASFRWRVGTIADQVPASPPPATLHLPDGDLEVPVVSSCWMTGGAGVCRDGAFPEHFVDAGSPDSVDFSFPVDGWTFQADFRPAGSLQPGAAEHCWRSRMVVLEPQADGEFHLKPLGPPGTYAVGLFGNGPQGDWSGTFLWTTTSVGAEPPVTATTGMVWAPHGEIEGDRGFTLSVAGLSSTPETATVSVTATAANGRSTTFDGGRPSLGCPESGTVDWWEWNGRRSQQVVALGPAPFTYDVTLVLDGVEHHATATWPDDHVEDPFNDDPAPVPLVFDPPLS